MFTNYLTFSQPYLVFFYVAVLSDGTNSDSDPNHGNKITHCLRNIAGEEAISSSSSTTSAAVSVAWNSVGNAVAVAYAKVDDTEWWASSSGVAVVWAQHNYMQRKCYKHWILFCLLIHQLHFLVFVALYVGDINEVYVPFFIWVASLRQQTCLHLTYPCFGLFILLNN